MILALIDEAIRAGARIERACDVLGIRARCVQRWRASGQEEDRRHGPLTTPGNKLTPEERQKVLALANEPCYRDLSPKQIVPLLADKGLYVASESTVYRILREERMLTHRAASRPPVTRPKAQVATGPGEVWSQISPIWRVS